MSGNSDFQRMLFGVVNFLQNEGFTEARDVLLQQYVTIRGSLESSSASAPPLSVHGSSGGGNGGDIQHLLASTPARDALELEHGSATMPEPGATGLELDLTPGSPLKLTDFTAQAVPWDDAVDEYDTPEDVGYQRKDVVGQQQFLENELETELDREAGNQGSGSHLHGLSNTTNTSGSEFAGDSESSCGSSISGAVIDLMPTSSGTMSAPPGSPQGGAPIFGHSLLELPYPTTGDTAWDLGPVDIKIAEPVTTPTKSSGNIPCDEPKPVLSRVESLSSSFKDFDIECNEDDLPSRRVSNAQEGGTLAVDINEVIDFHPTTRSSAQAELPAELDLAAASQPELDLAPPSPPKTNLEPVLGMLTLAPPVPVQEPVLAVDDKEEKLPPRAPTAPAWPGRLEDPRENVGGGFSFPIATTPTEVQPVDHRLFKSWPSVRSSCTSEVIAASDDDHVAADYADDEYLRSVSKPTSRSTSQNLGDMGKACSRGEEDIPASQQSGLEGWSFAQPMQPTTSNSGQKQDSSTEPHLLSPTSPKAKPTTLPPSTSCISEPSTTTSYNTCLPPGFGSAGVVVCPTSPSKPVSTPQSPAAAAAAVQGEPVSAAKADSSASVPSSTKEASQTQIQSAKQTLGGEAATASRPSPTTQPADASNSPGPSVDTTTALPVAHRVSSDQQSEDMTTADGEDDNAGEDEFDDNEEQHDQDQDQDELDCALEAAATLDWQQVPVHPASPGNPPAHNGPRYTQNEDGTMTFEYDPEFIATKYEILDLRVYHRRHRTGFEETKDFPIRMHDLIAGRYQVVDFLGSAAFSRAVQALDIKTGVLVCLKIIKNNKDYLDQSLDEIKLLKYVNTHDPADKFGVVRLYDYFYYKEHLFLVCELLRANLYEFQKYNRESGDAPYFTNARIQRIAKQVLESLTFIHALGLIHSDLKPENILIKSYSKCEVKVIDLGSSCFITDQLSSYVQSRSYRAPEVILGLPYDQKVDIWSLGCILAELSSGQVLFQNDSLATLLARLEGILGPVPQWMVRKGRYANRFYTRSGQLYEKNAQTERYELLASKRTSLRHRVPDADDNLLSFIASLLQIDPNKRPTAHEAAQHPWLHMQYSE